MSTYDHDFKLHRYTISTKHHTYIIKFTYMYKYISNFTIRCCKMPRVQSALRVQMLMRVLKNQIVEYRIRMRLVDLSVAQPDRSADYFLDLKFVYIDV